MANEKAEYLVGVSVDSIDVSLERIKNLVVEVSGKKDLNYGHAGSLSHVEELLDEIEHFLSK